MEAAMKILISSFVLIAVFIAVEIMPAGQRSDRHTENSFVVAQGYCPNGRC
jgi:hypothetical protein